MRQVKSIKDEAGFTLIESALSMYFIAFIILFLSASLISLFSTYNKSVWLGNIDQAMRQMRQDIVDAAKYTSRSKNLPMHHRFCVGGVSYLWNTNSEIERARHNYNSLINHWGDKQDTPLRLVRIKDPSGYYCNSPSAQPNISDNSVQSLLNGGATLQSFTISQDILPSSKSSSKQPVPIIHISGSIATDGINSPVRVREEGNKLVVVGDEENGSWQCGDYIDANHNGRRDRGDLFRPNKGQFCANTQIDMTVYERGTVR